MSGDIFHVDARNGLLYAAVDGDAARRCTLHQPGDCMFEATVRELGPARARGFGGMITFDGEARPRRYLLTHPEVLEVVHDLAQNPYVPDANAQRILLEAAIDEALEDGEREFEALSDAGNTDGAWAARLDARKRAHDARLALDEFDRNHPEAAARAAAKRAAEAQERRERIEASFAARGID